MITPKQARETGLAGTDAWKRLEAEIDSTLCGWMAEAKPKRSVEIEIAPKLVARVVTLYGSAWKVEDLGTDCSAYHNVSFSLLPEDK